MTRGPGPLLRSFSPETKRSWGRALIKTGTEHLDLSMVRHGRKVVKDAEAEIAAELAKDKPPGTA